MLDVEYVILGGGVAGLCAARRLVELGAKPLLIEAGGYPTHKVCGEFFSPSSGAMLQKWGIHLIPLTQASLYTQTCRLTFTFPIPAGTLSHLTFDPLLAKQIEQQGGTLLTHTRVQELSYATREEEYHILGLSSGETVLAKHLLIATGRIPHFSVQAPQVRYMGFKAHFEKVEVNSTLHLFSFPGAYLGLAPIEEGKVNVACLAQLEVVQRAQSPQHFMQSLVDEHPLLRDLLSSGRNLCGRWLEAVVPEFGLRSTPNWPRSYFIGDAAGTIPPASGNGLSLALAGGSLAAEFAIKDDAKGFKRTWRQYCSSQIFLGKRLHDLFLHPFLGNWVFRLGEQCPSLVRRIFSLTRTRC